MGKLLYGLPTENVAENATITLSSGTLDTDYPLANLVDLNPALPGQFTSNTCRVVFNFGVAQRVDVAAIVMHNLTAALANVKIEANATDAWGAPSLSQAFTIPTYDADDFPINPFLDLTGAAGYLVGGYQYWSFVVGTANGAAVKIGEIVLQSVKRTLTRTLEYGVQRIEHWPSIVHETDFGVKTVYPYNSKQRSFYGVVKCSDAQFAEIQTLYRSARGMGRPFIVALDSAVNDIFFARVTEMRIVGTNQWRNRHDVALGFEELSRGLPL